MTKQEMMDERVRQDMRASQSDFLKRQKEVRDAIEDRELTKHIPMNDDDYYEQMFKEIA
ncbi:hypothetical protein CA267_001855 [Alteromonas pelagimontana]|uniref:Uncharacterized protein n=1 Tax=Alteromonas pelagimontana TaxID=1858656 RepID=A0A6M4M9Y9_9ALTE|nr:hypothetical protein [Alteromonas pelagimontana]QJR79628.1 hypothetical protein CA267_001855 [Alteromonas pelagimontana]